MGFPWGSNGGPKWRPASPPPTAFLKTVLPRNWLGSTLSPCPKIAPFGSHTFYVPGLQSPGSTNSPRYTRIGSQAAAAWLRLCSPAERENPENVEPPGSTGRIARHSPQAVYFVVTPPRTVRSVTYKELNMSCDPLVFTKVDAGKFACVSQKVTAAVGIPINAPIGTASKGGYTVAWNYNEKAGSLTIQCLDSPFTSPCIAINAKIKGLVASCGVAT
jgi:hypothetical protein